MSTKFVRVLTFFLFFFTVAYISASDIFESEDGSVIVSNKTKSDLVVFAGKPQKNIMLGGIKVGAERSFNLKKLPEQFVTGAFILRAVSYDVYKSEKKVLDSDCLFSSLVVFDTTCEEVKTLVNIPEIIDVDMNNVIYVTNSSPFILELCLQNPTGQKVVTIPPITQNVKVFLFQSLDGVPYYLFPVYVYVDQKQMRG